MLHASTDLAVDTAQLILKIDAPIAAAEIASLTYATVVKATIDFATAAACCFFDAAPASEHAPSGLRHASRPAHKSESRVSDNRHEVMGQVIFSCPKT